MEIHHWSILSCYSIGTHDLPWFTIIGHSAGADPSVVINTSISMIEITVPLTPQYCNISKESFRVDDAVVLRLSLPDGTCQGRGEEFGQLRDTVRSHNEVSSGGDGSRRNSCRI